MNKLKFRIFAEPFSINKAYYLKSYKGKGAKKIRTVECREWGDRIFHQLKTHIDSMRIFRSFFDEKKHAIHIEIQFYIPAAKFYTDGGTGHISIASSDITNIEKLLVDVLFDERFNDRALDGSNIENININDKFITRMVSAKNPRIGKDYFIDIDVKRVKKPDPVISEPKICEHCGSTVYETEE